MSVDAAKDVAPYVKRHPNGTWYVRKHLGRDPVTGRKREAYKTLAATDARAALAEAGEYLENLGRNPYVPDAFEDFLRARERMRSPVNTLETYRTCARWLAPYFSRIRVRDLSTRDVNEAYMEMLDHGDRDGDPLSASTLRTVNGFLSSAYRWFAGQGLADSNPTRDAMRPPREVHEARALDEQSVATLLGLFGAKAADESDGEDAAWSRSVVFAAWLALFLGVRVGEACGLARADVHALHAQGPYVHVHSTVVLDHGRPTLQPKTKGRKSRNVSVERGDLDVILAHERWQGRLFDAAPGSPLVSADGSLASPRLVSAAFRRIALDLGLPDWTHFHTLRHTHATLALQGGADVNTVQERLGHASASTTLDIYGHVLPGRDQELARRFHDSMGLLGGGS